MKVAVIGKGTSSILTTFKLIERGHKVSIYFDPETPHISVGESTTPRFATAVCRGLKQRLTYLYQNDIISHKMGVKFIGWGSVNDSFINNFDENYYSFHFESGIFNPYCHNHLESSGLVQYFPEKINGYEVKDDQVVINNRTYDFLISCSGWGTRDDQYYYPKFETVNSAILHTQDFLDEDFLFTLHTATEHGWQFGLPFPKRNITKCGYLYNRNITSYEEVINEKSFLKGCKKIEWKQKYAKSLIQNKFHAYNGNKLFFFEPLQALSLDFYLKEAENICRFLEDRSLENYFSVNKDYLLDMWNLQYILAFHYMFGSKHETSFWEKTSKSAKDFFDSSPYSINFLKEVSLSEHLLNKPDFNILYFNSYEIDELISGFTGQKIQDYFNERFEDLKYFLT